MAANQLPLEIELGPQAGFNVPNGLIVPNGLNVHEQPAPPAPQPTFCERHGYLFKFLFFTLIVVGFFIGGWLSSRPPSRHHQRPSFSCGLATKVALDGSGDYTSLGRALEMAPSHNDLQHCIYIKSGVYKENVIINKNQINMVLIGEGIEKTVVTGGNHSSRATLEVFGDGFIAKDIAFERSLQPTRNGAAAYILADKCAFHRCSFHDNQLALNVRAQRQFFRDCIISGTTSVISGWATTVFQNCTIMVAPPVGKDSIISLRGAKNTRAGFIFQACKMMSINDSDLVLGNTFIAAPLGNNSRVVVMNSYMAGLISPVGWIKPNGTSVLYAEFQNNGPGSDTSRRLHSSGIETLSHSEASNFSVKHILEYDKEWLDSTGIPYWGDLVTLENESSVGFVH